MRFLVDNALPPRLASLLADARHDAVHVRDLGLGTAPDDVLFQLAAREDRILHSEDADFGTLLATRSTTKPSVVLLRHQPDKTATALAGVLLANLPVLATDLADGALVIIERDRVRVRRLPLMPRGG